MAGDGAPPTDDRSGLLSLQFSRFVLVGTAGFLVDAGVLHALVYLASLDPYSARVLSFLVAMTFTWLCNRSYTFSTQGRPEIHLEWLGYFGVNLIGALINYAVYIAFLGLFAPFPGDLLAGVAAGSLAGLFWNFGGSRFLIYRESAG